MPDDASNPGQVVPDESTLTAGPGSPQLQLTARPGDRFGNYKILEEIGQGGCGVVFVAEQEKPVRRRVALKVVKLGMDTRQVIGRFEAERQALALMDHPNIAKVLDAGATDTGRPFFVMELVKGIKITDYCDQHNLSTTDRLQLFMQVCSAVQHAHQKGIIHRDLKPSNILVTLHDGVPIPKVIDFGIAKATADQKLTDKTVYTALEQFLGTPAYMSPEQAEMTGLDVDTRSDIYSLGVLLYELLTGETPFNSEELLAQGIDAMRRTLREKDPAPPSTRLSTMMGPDLTVIALHRQADAPKLVKLVRGDLDWIVMKCLEKDRTRRYDTANGLAMDIERHLKNEPVVARPPSRLYRFRKAARRNKLVFGAVGAVTAALMIGLGISTWEFVKEREARQAAVKARADETVQRRKAEADQKAAQVEASKSRQVAQFLKEMLQGVGPSRALGRDTTMLREILDKTAERMGTDLINQPEVELELRLILMETYYDLGQYERLEVMARQSLQLARARPGVKPDEQDAYVAHCLYSLGLDLSGLGKLKEAEKCFEEELAVWRKQGNQDSNVASALDGLGQVLMAQGRLAEAEALQREALALQRKLMDGDLHVASRLNNLGLTLDRGGKFVEAEIMQREALAIRRRLCGDEHPYVASSLNNLATSLVHQNKLAEAEPLLREALATRRKLLGNEHRVLIVSLNNLGVLLEEQGKFAEAEAPLREAVAMSRKLNAPDLDLKLKSLAHALRQQSKLPEAEALLLEALGIVKQQFGNEHWKVAELLGDLAEVSRRQNALTSARALAEEATAMHQRHPDWPSGKRAVAFFGLGVVLTDLGDLAGAEALYQEELQFARARLAPDDTLLAGHIARQIDVLFKEKKFAESEPLARESLAIREKKLPPDDWDTFSSRTTLGEALLGQKKYAEAEPFLLSGYEGMDRHGNGRVQPKSRLSHALQLLVGLYEATGQPEKAAEWNKKLTEMEKAGK